MIELQTVLMIVQVSLTLVVTGAIALFTAAEFFLPRYRSKILNVEEFESGDGWKVDLLIENVGWGKGEINKIRGVSKVMGKGWEEDSSVSISRQPISPIHLMPKIFRGNSAEIEITARNADKTVDFIVDVFDARIGRIGLGGGFTYETREVEGPFPHFLLWLETKLKPGLDYKLKN